MEGVMFGELENVGQEMGKGMKEEMNVMMDEVEDVMFPIFVKMMLKVFSIKVGRVGGV